MYLLLNDWSSCLPILLCILILCQVGWATRICVTLKHLCCWEHHITFMVLCSIKLCCVCVSAAMIKMMLVKEVPNALKGSFNIRANIGGEALGCPESPEQLLFITEAARLITPLYLRQKCRYFTHSVWFEHRCTSIFLRMWFTEAKSSIRFSIMLPAVEVQLRPQICLITRCRLTNA